MPHKDPASLGRMAQHFENLEPPSRRLDLPPGWWIIPAAFAAGAGWCFALVAILMALT